MKIHLSKTLCGMRIHHLRFCDFSLEGGGFNPVYNGVQERPLGLFENLMVTHSNVQIWLIYLWICKNICSFYFSNSFRFDWKLILCFKKDGSNFPGVSFEIAIPHWALNFTLAFLKLFLTYVTTNFKNLTSNQLECDLKEKAFSWKLIFQIKPTWILIYLRFL